MSNSLRLQQLTKLLDVTRLDEQDQHEQLHNWLTQLPVLPVPVAAFCVYPAFLTLTRDFIAKQAQPIALATVVNFPSGDEPLPVVVAQINTAIQQGATEIDCVLPYKALLRQEVQMVTDFLAAVRTASQGVCLKIIIESGELQQQALIQQAAMLVIDSGADFIKTSTGKVPVGVTRDAAVTILTCIAQARRAVGFKASGGVRAVAQALELVDLYEEITGKTAVNTGLRIGASALVSELHQQLSV